MSIKGCIAAQVNEVERDIRLGQKVRFSRGYPHRSAPDEFYEVVRELPETDGEPYYRITSSREPHERVVKENEIQKT